MEHNASEKSVSLTQKNRRKHIWYKVVSAMASVVVFCTTYALILPAITLSEDYYCGKEEHTHTESCYRTGPIKTSICAAQPHVHTDSCYDFGGSLVCGMADFFIHTHGEICYDGEGKLVCQMEERPLHVHSEACYLGEYVYSCGESEGQGHIHNDACYRLEYAMICEEQERDAHLHDDSCYEFTEVLLCGQEECDSHFHDSACYTFENVLTCTVEGHTHGDSCYSQQEYLTCTLEETNGHTHDDTCYGQEKTLKCSLIEGTGHTHSEETCYGDKRILECTIPEGEKHWHDETCLLISEPVLVCDKPELVLNAHDPECQDENGLYTCGKLAVTEHIHTEECFHTEELETPELICELEEHVHELICTSDASADLETAEIWRTTVPAAEELTGIPAQDLVIVAKSQMGYHESTRNFAVTESEERKGYTRYGQWYGDPYGDWCAMYVSFCAYYAGIPETVLPYQSNCQSWLESLEALSLYRTAAEHTPVSGDIVFFGGLETGATHVGIVEKCIDGEIITIEGNVSDCVESSRYVLTDETNGILGYASIEAIHNRGIDLGLWNPLPEEEESKTVRLEADYGELSILLEIPDGAIAEDADHLMLSVQEASEDIQSAVSQHFGEDITYTALNVQLLNEETPVEFLLPVRLSIGIYDAANVPAAYILNEEQGFTELNKEFHEEGFLTMELDKMSTIVMVYPATEQQSESVSLEAVFGKYQVFLEVPAEAVVVEDTTKLQLLVQEPSEENKACIAEQVDEGAAYTAMDVQLLNNGTPVELLQPVKLKIGVIDSPTSLKVYSLAEDQSLAALDATTDESGFVAIDLSHLGTIVVSKTPEPKYLSLEADGNGVHVELIAPEEDFGEDVSVWQLLAVAPEAELLDTIEATVAADQTVIPVNVSLLKGEEIWPDLLKGELSFKVQDEKIAAAEDLALYRIVSGESVELVQVEYQTTEDSTMTVTSAEPGMYAFVYTKPYEGMVMETDCGDLHVTLQADPKAFVAAPGALALTAAEMDADILSQISGKLNAFQTTMGLNVQVMSGDTEVQPEVPVKLIITDKGTTFEEAEQVEVYQYSGTTEQGAANLTQLSSSHDTADVTLTTSQLSGLVIACEAPFDGIQLQADYGDIHIRLRAPYDAFPVTAENLSLLVTEPEESMKASIAESMGEEQAYFAVDIQILCDGEPIQPNGDVQVIFEMKDDPFPSADEVVVFHVVEDTEKKTLDMREVEGGYNDDGNVVMETNHFSTYVVTESGASRAVAFAAVPPNTWEEALTDRSSYIGVESEGYADSPYTNTRQFEGANITSLTNSGGTVYVGGKWGIYYDYAFYAETFWDGKKPVRITSDPGHQNDLRKSIYSDWILEDTADPYGALKIDNVNLVLYGLGNQKFELYGRGNKIVIGENVNTDDLMSHSPPYIYGGSRTNDSTTSGYPTNVVVTSGRWGLVMGGGGADVNDGTQVTIRDTAEVGIVYGGGIDDGDVSKGSSQNATNVYIEGGNVTEVYGGNQTTSTGIKVNGDINIDVSGGQVGTIHAGNDHRGIEGTDELKGSKVRGGAVVNVYNTGSVTNVVGDYMHYDATYGDQLITFQGANGQYTTKGRHIRDLVELNIHSNNEFGYMDYWDIIRINNLDANAAPNSVNVTSLQGVVKIGDRVVNNVGSEYIGRMEVTNGGRFYVKDNCFINFMNEVNTTSEEGVTSFNLNHAWMGESTEERRAWSTLAVEGSCIEPSTAATNLFTLSNPCDGGYAGLRIKGNVEGFSTLEACGDPMYSTGDTYYYYVVADSSDNGGKAFREPEGAPYVVCYRYLDDGRIGWYLRERPVLTMDNSLVRVGTEGILTPTENGVYTEYPSNYVVLHVDMKGFAYEWSNTPGKNRVEFEWSIFDGYENATETTGGISLQTMADIENNIYCTSNPNGIFTNVKYEAMGSDEGSSEQTKRVSSFDVIIDTSKAVNPRYYEVSTSFHYTRGTDDYDDLRVGQTADAARCTYDFAKDGEELGNDGYANSVMTTYEYKDGIPPKGADDALLRVYLPEGVSTNTLTVKELDEHFTFEKTGIAASLVSNSQVAQYYSTEEESTYNHMFGVTLQQTGDSEIDLAGGATLNNLSGKETYHCAVYSHEKISFTDITPESNLGLQLQLQLNSLTKGGNAVGNGDPSAVNDGELRIQVYPVGTIIDTTTVTVKKIVTGDNPSTTAEFEFLLSYPKINENGQNVTHEERFTLKHNEEKTVIVPLETEITIKETNSDGYHVQTEINDSKEMVYSDTSSITTPDKEHLTGEELKVTFYNTPGVELPKSGGFGTQIHTFLGLLLTLGAIALFWMHRRERGTVC